MKIFIDPEDARSSELGSFYRAPHIDASGVWLPLALPQQLQSRWCWAAIASTVGAYYGASQDDQATIASALLLHHTDAVGNYTEEDRRTGNVNFKLDTALKYAGCFGHWSIGKPGWERILFEINQGRPPCVRLEWYRGGAHYILIRGYSEDGHILIEDSLHGASKQAFESFPDHYHNGGAVWTETFWTNKQ